jgi:protein CrcB
MTWFWVTLGSALGGLARYWLSGFAAQHIRQTFPIGTLIVNVTGSFVIGFFATLTGPDGRVFVGTDARQFVMTGICGGYTTFSSFMARACCRRRAQPAQGSMMAPVSRRSRQALRCGVDVKRAPG